MIPAILMSFLHFLDYAVNLFFLGFVFFIFVIKRSSLHKKWLYLGYGGGLVTSVIWWLASAVDMADGWDFQAIGFAMSKTDFAHWWCFRLLLLFAGLVCARFVSGARKSGYAFLALSFIVPIFSSLTSHAGTSETYRTLRIALDYTHFVAASVWGGGLLGIFIFLHKIRKNKALDTVDVYGTVKRFSHFAMVSTGLLMASGIVQVYLIENSLSLLWASNYGKLVFLKLFLFCSALLAAAVNQFYHMGKFKPGNELKFALSVKREVGLEIGIIFIVLAVTSFLTRANLPGM